MRRSHGVTSLKDLNFKKAKATINSVPVKWKDKKTGEIVTGIQVLHPGGFRIALPSVRVIDDVTETHMIPVEKKVTREIPKDGKIVKDTGKVVVRKPTKIPIKRPRVVSYGGTVVGKQGDWMLLRKDGTVFAMKEREWNQRTGAENPTIIHKRFDRGSA